MAFPPTSTPEPSFTHLDIQSSSFSCCPRPSSHAASANTPWDSASSHTRCASWRSTPLRLSSMTAPLYPISRDAQYRTADWAYASSSMRRTRISLTITSSTTSEAYPLPMSRSRIAPDGRGAASSSRRAASLHASKSFGSSGIRDTPTATRPACRACRARSACHCRQWTEFGRNRIRFDRPAADHRRKGQGPNLG